MAYRSTRLVAAALFAIGLCSCASGAVPGAQDDAGPAFDAGGTARDAGLPFGEPCDEHSQCESELCYHPVPGEPGYCTASCDDLCPDGFACRTVVISEGVNARICVPASDTFCSTCADNSDCGDSTDLCLDLTDGKFCSIDCAGDPSVCPTGFTCVVIQGAGDIVIGEQCKPLNGLCCVDGDGDFRGEGDGCRQSDCDDDNPVVYDDADEVCDGFDNDCLGGVDVDVTDCAPGSCKLGALGYYETPSEVCTAGACAAPSSILCDLYTCTDGADLGDICANACDVEADAKCIPAAHCDGSLCYDDFVNGEVCDEESDCASDHCQNGFCCNTADCCQMASDCPTYGTFDPICENPATCQGSRGEAICADFMCGTTGGVADDSACDAGVEANECGWYTSVYCDGEVLQSTPSCPTSCASHSDCDPGGQCNPGSLTCIEDFDDGGACGTDDARCKSGHCQNGYCCSSGDCCRGASDCPGGYSTAPVCDSASTCQGTRDVAQCISAVCSTLANEPDDSACTGGGAPAHDCGPYLPVYCDGSIDQPDATCATACSTDAQCDANAYCTGAGVCAPDQGDGSTCNDAAECVSDHCNNGFCCAAGGLCCATDGNCNSLDEASQCDSQTTCQGHRVDGVCSPATFQCGSNTVDDDSGCAGLDSNDCGLYPTVSCNSNVAQPTDQAARCNSTCIGDGDCDVSGHCEAPSCVPDVGPGGFCADPSDCDPGLTCVDDVCCATSCTGACRACDLMGTTGTCTSVPDGDDPDAECNGVGCAGYYWGWTGDTCYQKLDVSTGAATCGGDDDCQRRHLQRHHGGHVHRHQPGQPDLRRRRLRAHGTAVRGRRRQHMRARNADRRDLRRRGQRLRRRHR